jgi:hypothetical protein
MQDLGGEGRKKEAIGNTSAYVGGQHSSVSGAAGVAMGMAQAR